MGPHSEEPCLIEPSEELTNEYIAYSEEFRAAGEPFVYQWLDDCGGDFGRLLESWRDEAAGRNLREGIVPCSRYWLVSGRRILGAARLRYHLTEALEDDGGHIGYDVRPSERRKGHATRLLALMLGRARQIGLRRVLLTCDADNTASSRVIEHNGGKLVSQGPSKRSGKPILRYWIDLDIAR